MITLEGPIRIDCDKRCEIPEGVRLGAVPVPRHAWDDVAICPHGCGRAFLVLDDGEPKPDFDELSETYPGSGIYE